MSATSEIPMTGTNPCASILEGLQRLHNDKRNAMKELDDYMNSYGHHRYINGSTVADTRAQHHRYKVEQIGYDLQRQTDLAKKICPKY